MPVIRTAYLGATNHLGSRVKASAHSAVRGRAVSVTVHWDHGLNVTDNHLRAARKLAEREGWSGVWSSVADDGGGYLFIRNSEQRGAFALAEQA